MSTGALRNDMRSIKRSLYFDPDAQVPRKAIDRHFERRVAVSWMMVTPMEMDLATAPNMTLRDLSRLDRANQTASLINTYATSLGQKGLKQWRDDQRTIERYFRTKHGGIDAFVKRPEFGDSPEAMWAHLSGRFCEFVHSKLKKKEQIAFRKELRNNMRQLFDEPIKLHPATGGDRGQYFDPETILGRKYYAMRFAFPCADFPNLDPNQVVILEEDDD